MRCVTLTDFFRIKVIINCTEDNNVPDYVSEIISYVRNWLIGKYGLGMVNHIIPDWSLFFTGGFFGNEATIGAFHAETAGFISDNGWGEIWACRIVEYPRHNIKYVPRKWITDIGIQPNSPKGAEISYSVKYDDQVDHIGKVQRTPGFNLPNVAKFILSSTKWACSIDGTPIDAELRNYTPYDGKLFKLEDCLKLCENSKGKHESDQGATVNDMNNRWISLCKVNRPDKNRDIWMQRLADSVNGTLVAPEIDESKDKIFGNRPLIFCEDGPDTPDTIGFWEWTERQNENGKWLSDATYIEHPIPTEIIILDKASNITEVVDSLKSGIHIPRYVHGSVLFAAKKDEIYEGVLCDLSSFNARSGGDVFISIKNNIYTLPCYELIEQDIFTWKYRKIYKHITLGEPVKIIQLYDFSDTIKQLLLQRMSWPVFKAQGITKSDWQKFKQFINDIPKDSIIEQLSEMYNLSHQEAHHYLDAFLQKVESYVDVSDIDSALIVQMLSNHQGLKELCDEVAYKKWCEEHKAEVQKATEEIAAIQAAADHKVAEAQQQLATVQKLVSSAELVHTDILAEIATADSKRKQLCADIARYEAIGNDTIVAVRQKIADAQEDMARFIADLSVFLPQAQPQAPVEPPKRVSLWQYECASSGVYTDDEIELSETWNDELDALIQNLVQSQAIHSDYVGMLSAFLYATHVNKIPLLIAGPAGRDFAEIMAVSLYASGAGHLWLGNEPANNIAEAVADYDECIVSVQNMFGKGWQDELPQSFAKLKKHIIWAHPYVEDMVIEPKGLLNYMLPVLSECFIESIPAGEPWPTKRAETFKAYASTKKQPLKIAAFKKLKMSKLLANRLTIVLSDAKAILNQPAKDKDMEILFGLLPLCVITGRIDILKEAIETESGLSSAVKTEANRYIEEE